MHIDGIQQDPSPGRKHDDAEPRLPLASYHWYGVATLSPDYVLLNTAFWWSAHVLFNGIIASMESKEPSTWPCRCTKLITFERKKKRIYHLQCGNTGIFTLSCVPKWSNVHNTGTDMISNCFRSLGRYMDHFWHTWQTIWMIRWGTASPRTSP